MKTRLQSTPRERPRQRALAALIVADGILYVIILFIIIKYIHYYFTTFADAPFRRLAAPPNIASVIQTVGHFLYFYT